MLALRNTKPAGVYSSGFFLGLLITAISLTAIPASESQANQASPFLTKNQSPFSLIYGLPLPSQARLLTPGQSRFTPSLNISNTLNFEKRGQEALLLDIETWQLNLIYDLGIADNWMLRVQLPFIAHTPGLLDNPIDAYHQALGLPENLRPDFPQNQLHIQYSSSLASSLNIEQRQKSVGDISLQLAWQQYNNSNGALSYWLGLKLPSGDEKSLSGSGYTDIASWLAINHRLSDTRWLYGQAGILYMSGSRVLSNMHNNVAAFSTAGIKFEPWENLELKMQLDMHSAFYDSELQFLGDIIQLTFGGSYRFRQHQFDFAVAEDIDSASSPDVNFNISWTHNF